MSRGAEKIASLVRSVVGRVPVFGVASATPLNRPEITRIAFTVQVHLRIPIMNNNGVLEAHQ